MEQATVVETPAWKVAPMTPEEFFAEHAEETQELLVENQDTGWSFQQNATYAILARTMEQYKNDLNDTGLTSFLFFIFLVPIGIGVPLLTMWGTHRLTLWLAPSLHNSALYTLSLLFVAVGLLYRSGHAQMEWTTDEDDEKIVGIRLGKLDEVIGYITLSAFLIFLTLLPTCQVLLLYFTTDHVGLPIDGSFWQCCLVTLNNLAHGLFLDIFELYNLDVGPSLKAMSSGTATVFVLFRLAFDAIVILIALTLYRRRSMRHFFDELPDSTEAASMLSWLDRISKRSNEWLRLCPDEFLFLTMTEEYLKNRFDVVRELGREFHGIVVSNSIRRFFVHPETQELLFPPIEQTILDEA